MLARGARVGGKISKEDWADAANGWGWVSVLGWWLAVSVSTLIVGALLVWLAPGALYAAERAVREHLGASVGWGVAIAIGVPLLAILALVTLVGIPFGVALLLAAIPVLLVAYATTAWLVGRRVLRNRSTSPWAALLAGWGILRVLALIPVVGASSGSRRRSWDSERWPSRCGRPAGRARPRRGPRHRLRDVPHRPPDRCGTVPPARLPARLEWREAGARTQKRCAWAVSRKRCHGGEPALGAL